MAVDTAILSERLENIQNTLAGVQMSIAGTPASFLDGLLDSIVGTLNRVRDEIVSRISSSLQDIWDKVDQIIRAVETFANNLIGAFSSIIDGLISKLQSMIDNIVAAFDSVINILKGYISSVISALVESVTGFITGIINRLETFIGGIKDAIENVVSTVKTAVENAYNAMRSFIDSIVTKIKEFGEKIAAAVESAWKNVVEKVSGLIREIWQKILEVYQRIYEKIIEAGEFIREQVIPFIGKLEQDTREGIEVRLQGVQEILSGMTAGNAEQVVSGISKVIVYREPTDLTSILAAAMTITAVAPAGISAALRVPLDLMIQRQMAATPIYPLPVGVLGEAVSKGLMGEGDAGAELAKQGIAPSRIGILTELARPLPSPGTVQQAFVRGIISEAEHDALLARAGYRGQDIQLFKALYWVIPPLSDIIRMAVREAFTPEIAEKFGQYEDLPKAFVEWAQKQGLSKEWAERYWAAHWDLPSVQMGYEMFHRRIIDENELKMLMRALDIMPFWREKLIQMSYSPYTRVDVRRMYSIGVLSKEDVYNTYRDLGYDDEHARNLTEFTIRYYTPEEETDVDRYRKLAQSVYIRAYKRGVITSEELINYLTGIGYIKEDAEFLLRLADAELALDRDEGDAIPVRSQVRNIAVSAYNRGLISQDEFREILGDLGYTEPEINWYEAYSEYDRTLSLKKMIVDDIRQRYVNRTIDKAKAVSELDKIFPYHKEVERLLEEWDIEREIRNRKPTEAQFRAALTRGIITPEEYAEELRGLGYPEKYVRMLTKLAGYEV